jgi:hypothetical protein
MSLDLTPLGQAGEWLGGAKLVQPLFEKLFYPALEQVGGMIADPLAEKREEWRAHRRQARLVRILSSTASQIERSGIEPMQLPDYLAVPFLEKATLVDDETLQEMWASLMANAAMPETASTIPALFTTILSNLSPRQARFLDIIFNFGVYSITIKIPPLTAGSIAGHSRFDDEKLVNIVGNTDFRWRDNEEKAAAIDVLLNQGLLRRDQEIHPDSYQDLAGKVFSEGKLKTPYNVPADHTVHMKNSFQLTVSGSQFVMACRPFDRRP